MNLLLPVLALALAVLSAFLPPREPAKDRLPGSRMAAAAALTILAIVAALKFSKTGEGVGLSVGLLAGLFAAGAAAWIGNPTTGLALGVAAAAILPMVAGTSVASSQFALIASAALSSLALGGAALPTAATAAAVAAAGYLGDQSMEHTAAPTLAVVVGLGAVVGGIVGQGLKSAAVKSLLPALGAVVAAGFLGMRVVNENGVVVSVLAGAVSGIAVRYLVPEDEAPDALRVGIAALIWLGVATLAFGLLKGFGMSLALLGGLAALVPAGGRKGLLTLGALSGLVMYRLLREAHPDASRALDIGQHYALIGLALGFLLPLLPTDWLGTGRKSDAAGAFLWGLLALGVPVLVLLVFGGVGAVGFIAGLGLSGLVQALRGRAEILPLPLGMGMAGITLQLSGWIETVTGLTRDEKLRTLGIAAVGIVVIAGLLMAVSGKQKEVAA